MADKIGNDLANEAADIGRQRVGADVNEARKCFAEICRAWYPVIRDLHRFFIAISRPSLMMTARVVGVLGPNLRNESPWTRLETLL